MIYSYNGERDIVLCEVGTVAGGIFVIDEAADTILYDVQTAAVETTECRT
jgi:hypothetical protein